MYAKQTADGVQIARTQIESDWVEVTDAPTNRIYRDAWELSGTTIVINATKQTPIDERIQRDSDATAVKGDAGVKAIINATPTQIENYINNNVTDLASAKDVLIRLAKAVSALGREAFLDD